MVIHQRALWDWSGGNGNNTLWWDYTYSRTSILNGKLPDGFISITVRKEVLIQFLQRYNYKRKSILSNNRYWLGGNNTGTGNVSESLQTTNHEWYDADYDHSNTDISDNQILWADGALDVVVLLELIMNTNILNPYTSYDSNYYAPSALYYQKSILINFQLKEKLGDYTISVEIITIIKGAVTYSGNYKWLLTKLSWSASRTYSGTQNHRFYF